MFPGACPQKIFAWIQNGQVWRVLQATSQQSQNQIWPAYKLQTRKSFWRWVVQCCTNTGLSCQINTRNCKYAAQRYILVLSQRWRFCFQNHQKMQCWFTEVPCKQNEAACKENGGIKDYCLPYKASCKWFQAAKIILMRHQRTDFPPSKSKQKQQSFKSRSKSCKKYSNEHKQQVPPYKKKFDPNQAHSRKDGCSKCGDSKHVEGLKYPAMKFQCKTFNKYGHFTSFSYKKKVSF